MSDTLLPRRESLFDAAVAARDHGGLPRVGGAPPYLSSDLATGRGLTYEWEFVCADILDRLLVVETGGGSGGGGTITHVQSVPASLWTVPHTFPVPPDVIVVDVADQQLIAEIHYPDSSTVVIIHGQPFAGVAYLRV